MIFLSGPIIYTEWFNDRDSNTFGYLSFKSKMMKSYRINLKSIVILL